MTTSRATGSFGAKSALEMGGVLDIAPTGPARAPTANEVPVTGEADPEVVLRAVAEAPDAVVIVDSAGVVRYWNDGAARIFGYGPEEMLGSTLDAIIPERLRQRHGEGFRAAMARGSTRYGADDLLAVPARHAQGRTISIEFSVVLLKAGDGSVSHIGAIMRDVTERRSREQELRRRIDLLERSQQAP